jgi:LmbE family N-acetylglucosaminyl deacetylase
MNALCVHAHFDDFEFVVSGLFTLWRGAAPGQNRAKVLVCTDGAAGHHLLSREETARVRLQEQMNSARIGGYEFELLQLPDGQVPRETRIEQTRDFLPALWRSVRSFEPDYLFSPPIPDNPMVGVHIDHVDVAEAVRDLAYLINVPHAFAPEYADSVSGPQWIKTPVILTVYDSYMAAGGGFDLVIDVEEVFEVICQMAYCHQSQIAQWLPWIGRHEMETITGFPEWLRAMRKRFTRRNQLLGIDSPHALEFFNVTAWGTIPSFDQLLKDFPNIQVKYSRLDALRNRLDQWHGIVE